MKVSIITMFIIFISACSDIPDFSQQGPIYGPFTKLSSANFKGDFNAEKNGSKFEGNIVFINHSDICYGCFSFAIVTFADSISHREQFIFYNMNIYKKEYNLFPRSGTNNEMELIGYNKKTEVTYYTSLDDGDVPGDTYVLYEGVPNWVKFESIDTINGIINGSLQVHFEKSQERDVRNPKYVKISNAEFTLFID